jgi:uncharacterized protein
MTRIFFVTDPYGSGRPFMKFVKTVKVYKADVTSKLVISISKPVDGRYALIFLGDEFTLTNDQELKDMMKKIADSGYYGAVVSQEEVAKLDSDQKLIADLSVRLTRERITRCNEIIDERFTGSNIKLFVADGNDDPLEVDNLLEPAPLIHAEGS